MTRRRRPRAGATAAGLLLAIPAAAALAFAQTPAPALTTPTTPVQIVAEDTGTARDIVPFGAAREGARLTAWATGRTRAPSAEPPSTPEAYIPPRAIEPVLETSPPPTEPVAEREAVEPTTPGDTVLLTGTAASADAPTAWRRADPPLGPGGTPLVAGGWRVAGGRGALHAGEATPGGAAALLIGLGASDTAAQSPAILARRADGRFAALPEPPAPLLAPATALFDPASSVELPPLAAIDLVAPGDGRAPSPTPVAGDTTPSGTTPGATTPSSFTGTGLLLAPAGTDGVLRWDGATWTEEPYEDAAGEPITTPRSPVALAATPDGDGVAMLAGDPTGPDRVRLYRRTADRTAWREVVLADAPLLQGALPTGVTAVRPTARPGDPLTVTDGHWWVDVIVDRSNGAATEPTKVHATIHLTPGRGAPGTTPPATPAPTDPAPTDPAPTSSSPAEPTPGVTTPAGSTPGDTTPAGTTPTATTPPGALLARSRGTWCVPPGSGDGADALPDAARGEGCTHELVAGFPTDRGYRSQAFPGGAFGHRVITSPVIDADAAPGPSPDASASGGYLVLDGTRFRLRSGLGDSKDGRGGTEAAAFISDRSGWVGGRRATGRIMARATATAATPVDTAAWSSDSIVDVAVSPDGTDASEEGMLALTASLQIRRTFTIPRGMPYADSALAIVPDTPRVENQGYPIARVIDWPRPNVVVAAGNGGLLRVGSPPPLEQRSYDGPRQPYRAETIGAADGMDLVAVAFTDSGPLNGWAVGRDGAAVRCRDGRWARVMLAEAAARADLRAVAYAGDTALVASAAGLLVAPDDGDTLVLDTQLAALIEADGRDPGVRTVAGLPDGAAVVDGRYVRDAQGAPWRRLASPLEGDVAALAVARPPASQATPEGELEPLAIFAATADSVRPRRGSGVPGASDESERLTDLAPLATDGRLVQLTPDGWVDRNRGAIDSDPARDLPAPQLPIQDLDVKPGGDGWAASGVGGPLFFESMVSASRGATLPISLSLAGDAPPAEAPAVPDTPPPATQGPIRILVGGHPACMDTCAGRDDQRIAPTETLKQALETSARLHQPGPGLPSARAIVIGGGRSRAGSGGLSPAAASAYADLLQSVPGSAPVFPAFGAGDDPVDRGQPASADARRIFAQRVVAPLAPAPADEAAPGAPRAVTGLPSPQESDQDPTVAYAVDIPGDVGGAVRVIVIDHAGRAFKGGMDGAQARWLRAALDDARANAFPTVVIGGPPLDDVPDAPTDREQLIELLAGAGVSVYVSTNGSDDDTLPEFGGRLRSSEVSVRGGPLLTIAHSSALGHRIPYPVINRLFMSGDSDDAIRSLGDYSTPAVIAIDLPARRDGTAVAGPPARVTKVPVFASFTAPEPVTLALGSAGFAYATGKSDADNGLRWLDPEAPPEIGLQTSFGNGIADVTPDQCRLWSTRDECTAALPSDARFEVADRSVAIFVRARLEGRGRERSPTVVTGPDGNPLEDSSSPVLCPLKVGRTTATFTVSGQTTTMPIEVMGPRPGTPPPAPGAKVACSFYWGGSDDEPTAKAETAKPVPAPALPLPIPGPQPGPAPSLPPAPQPILRTLAPIVPFAVLPQASAPDAVPPVAPNPKPITNPPPPAPPGGVSVQQVQTQSMAQTIAVKQEERRTEVAREGSDLNATIYQPSPRPDAILALAGGALAILLAAGGHIAGRCRALSRAARGWLR